MADSKSEAPPLRWGRILGLLAALFLVCEAGAQAYFVHWTGKPYGSIFLYLWSPYGLVRNNPELTGNFEISPEGFRETRRYTQAKPPNTLRVLLMGGSVLYSGSAPVGQLSGYVSSSQTISQYLAARLRADPAFAGRNIEVINAGVNYNRITEVSSAYLADYIQWSPDVVVVFGSANNFPYAVRDGDMEHFQALLQLPHPWKAEFDRLVNERSLPSTIEVAFRQGVDYSASLAIFHKMMTRGFVENDPFARLSIAPPPPASAARGLASPQDEARYLTLYASYADAMIAAARRSNQKIAFVWEYHLRDLKGVKPFSADEEGLYPPAAAKRPQEDIDYSARVHKQWAALLNAEGAPTVDPFGAITSTNKTVFNDYLHYTATGNEVVAGAVYEQLRDTFLQAMNAPPAAPSAP